MSRRDRPKNAPASIRGRLEQFARRQEIELQRVLSEFAIERFLFRLGASRHADRFVLKGGTLLGLWFEDQRRATWDIDLLGRSGTDPNGVVSALREICRVAADDGIEFDEASITAEEIRSPDEYGGLRVRFNARLSGARIPMQVDVGFGDVVRPPLPVARVPQEKPPRGAARRRRTQRAPPVVPAAAHGGGIQGRALHGAVERRGAVAAGRGGDDPDVSAER